MSMDMLTGRRSFGLLWCGNGHPKAVVAGLLVLVACGGGGQAGAAGPAGTGQAAAQQKSSSPAKAGPLDACALLTAAEVAPLVPGAQPEASTSGANGGPTYRCDWGPAAGGLPTLQVSVTPDSPALKQGLGANRDYLRMVFANDAKENSGRVVTDLGDLAKVESVIALSAEATVILGTTWLEVEYSGQGAQAKQDRVLALARAAVKRLGSGK
jgi:hypothetical protein